MFVCGVCVCVCVYVCVNSYLYTYNVYHAPVGVLGGLKPVVGHEVSVWVVVVCTDLPLLIQRNLAVPRVLPRA